MSEPRPEPGTTAYGRLLYRAKTDPDARATLAAIAKDDGEDGSARPKPDRAQGNGGGL